jgi:hypothetical protein
VKAFFFSGGLVGDAADCSATPVRVGVLGTSLFFLEAILLVNCKSLTMADARDFNFLGDLDDLYLSQ